VFRALPAPTAAGWPDRSIRLAPVVDLDLATETRARAELAAACNGDGEHRRVVVIVGERCFVDVRGIAVLVDAARLARLRGCELIVIDTAGRLRKYVAALALDSELPVLVARSEVD
jgi:anti-anti-sigma regulatory factor